MSGLGPGGGGVYTKPIPPQRGSFPLDHDGECTDVMKRYLTCIKKVKGVNENECRELAKSYLSCRMDRNLMAPDDFKNLGFQSPAEGDASSKTASGGDNSQAKPT
ncbi:hypothetical protein VPNG_01821 [Cytospora leucostoma]|uniref:CHCH domain-containing protein n=1 Tax=Cytospora leucostoma TaxID=1230097 RepID=A0A423XIF4_9PEZI|nr:hypothetical protein VPNG_01821 [Cytospora leucostoma]